MKEDALETMVRLRYEGAGDFATTAVSVRDLLDRKLVAGEHYRIDIYNERSEAFHNKYFATIAEAWLNLPDPWDSILPSPKHLRKYALIKAGWCDVVTLPLKSASDAIAAVSALKLLDSYCLAVPSKNVVTVYKARSQRRAFQDAASFHETAHKVFDVIASIIGVDPLTLYDKQDYGA